MSDKHIAKEKFEEAMEDFVSHNYGRSIQLLSQAIELNPEYGAAYHSRANLHAKLGEEILATEDIKTATALTEVNIEAFANDNNIWRSQHMKLEEMGVADTFDR